ncbi:MAG: hypothetical protein FWC89_13265 [Defluviitaleaceae bacterium]|nr:hypothetical protein [Defluviitaleaceae bacterium]
MRKKTTKAVKNLIGTGININSKKFAVPLVSRAHHFGNVMYWHKGAVIHYSFVVAVALVVLLVLAVGHLEEE